MALLYIAIGGAAGAVARYGISGWVQDRSGFEFPWGTLVVNLTGSLLLGLAMRYLEAVRIAPDMRALITIGILGAFTTFSTFSYETVTLLQKGAWLRAGAYALGSLVLGLAAVWTGMTMAAHLLHARS